MSLGLPGGKRGGRRAVFLVGGLLPATLRIVVPCAVGMLALIGGGAFRASDDLGTGSEKVAAAPVEIELREASWSEVQAMVTKQRGKVVVIDVWMTTCGPCLAAMPHFVALREKFGDEVVCISVNCDYAGLDDQPVATYRADAIAALKKHDAGRIENVLLTDPLLEFMEQAEIDATPTLFVYDRQGKLAAKFDNAATESGEEFTIAEVEAAIRRSSR